MHLWWLTTDVSRIGLEQEEHFRRATGWRGSGERRRATQQVGRRGARRAPGHRATARVADGRPRHRQGALDERVRVERGDLAAGEGEVRGIQRCARLLALLALDPRGGGQRRGPRRPLRLHVAALRPLQRRAAFVLRQVVLGAGVTGRRATERDRLVLERGAQHELERTLLRLLLLLRRRLRRRLLENARTRSLRARLALGACVICRRVLFDRRRSASHAFDRIPSRVRSWFF